MRVVLYTRPGCHLCAVARDVLVAERERRPFVFEEVSIEGDEELEHEYGIRVPVVEIDGREVFEYEVDAKELAGLLRAGGRSS
jgi:glutaredoxin